MSAEPLRSASPWSRPAPPRAALRGTSLATRSTDSSSIRRDALSQVTSARGSARPYRLEPQHQTDPSPDKAQVWSSAASTSSQAPRTRDPAILLGTSTTAVATEPAWSDRLSPQHQTSRASALPSDSVIAHVWSRPASMLITRRPAETPSSKFASTGCEPPPPASWFPSCPRLLSPLQNTRPSSTRAHW